MQIKQQLLAISHSVLYPLQVESFVGRILQWVAKGSAVNIKKWAAGSDSLESLLCLVRIL